jgi:NAD(P)-dependent dehydrogenase (short-subunit alcohol dehydrogenase family)
MEIRARWNYLDAIIHCAATQGVVGEAMNVDPIEWTDTVRANIEGAYFTVRAFFSLLHSSKTRGKVILFSGGGASRSRPNFSAYGCAKTALVRLVETLAEEWRELPIDINIVAPGAINTAMTKEIVAIGPERSGPREYERALKQLRSGGDSIEKVYSMVRFLLSPESDGISGKFFSAQWDRPENLQTLKDSLIRSEIYTLRRVIPGDQEWKG